MFERPAMKALTAQRGDGRINLQRATVTGDIKHELQKSMEHEVEDFFDEQIEDQDQQVAFYIKMQVPV